MADEQLVNSVKEKLAGVLSFREKNIVDRDEWGTLNFLDGKKNIKEILDLVSMLSALPLSELSESQINSFNTKLQDILSIFKQIAGFKIEQRNASQIRMQYLERLRQYQNALHDVATPLIGYLAIKQETIVDEVRNSLDKVTTLAADSTDEIYSKIEEMELALEAVRNSAAEGGAAVFTDAFQKESIENSKDASNWLIYSGVTAIITLLIASVIAFSDETIIPADASPFQGTQMIIGKAVILSVLLGSTVWCGRMYQALKHQSVVNMHRAISIKTLQAFRSSATDSNAKDAVVMEAAKAVFGNVPTGLIRAGANENSPNDVNIFDLTKSMASHQ